MKKLVLFFLLLILAFYGKAQYAPAAGQSGSTAIHMDSNVIVSWATQCTIVRGWQNMADHSLGKTITGGQSSVFWKADNDVASLGDGGIAIVQFAQAIANGPGPDFAIFENAFDDFFLELAFVEVSSDGQNYFRFPAYSLTQTDSQVVTFGTLQCEKIHNLAGKYRAGYGTPFDLEDLKNIPGLDIMNVTHIKIIDVVGSIDTLYATKDANGNIINDPFPTPFPIGGFDLDAVGVMHTASSFESENQEAKYKVYPNPTSSKLTIEFATNADIELISLQGQVLLKQHISGGKSVIEVGSLPQGVYLLRLYSKDVSFVRSFVKQ